MNYPTSQASIDMLKEAFRLDEQLSRYNSKKDELFSVFKTRRDINDTIEMKSLNYLVFILSIMQLLMIVVPGYFVETAPINYRMIGISMALILFVLYIILYTLYKRKKNSDRF